MRRVEKPWGHEEIWADCQKYAAKILHIRSGCRLSLQYHQKKEETIRVLAGELILDIGVGPGSTTQVLSPGDTFHVSPGVVHRFGAGESDVDLIEVSTPELDDVVRLEDDYDR